MSTAILQAYARRIRDKLRANAATPETGLAPDFQTLIAELIDTLPAVPALIVSPEYSRPGVGRSDIALTLWSGRQSLSRLQTDHTVRPIG